MIDSKHMEALIKNVLADYARDFNELNGEDEETDFNLTITEHTLDPEEVVLPEEVIGTEEEQNFRQRDPEDVYYLRISRTFLKSKEKRILVACYRPKKEFSKKDATHSMLREALKHLMVGGIEYAEALHRMHNESEDTDSQ